MNPQTAIYLDYQASTPMDPRVLSHVGALPEEMIFTSGASQSSAFRHWG